MGIEVRIRRAFVMGIKAMDAIKIIAHVDSDHVLSVRVPDSIQPGAVTVLILTAAEDDDVGNGWMAGVAHEWADELADVQQDIYTLDDGEAVDES